MRNKIMAGAALAALLAACGGTGGSGDKAEREARERPADATIVTPEGKAEIRSGTGAATAGLPTGIPAYPGADTTGSIQISGASAEGSGGIVGFRTSDSASQVVDFYAAAAERAGYRIAARSSFGANAMLTAQRGEDEVLNVTATPTPEGTQVQIIAGGGRR